LHSDYYAAIIATTIEGTRVDVPTAGIMSNAA